MRALSLFMAAAYLFGTDLRDGSQVHVSLEPRNTNKVPLPTPRKDIRVLLTDIMFPNAMAAWRLNEIGGFIEQYETDIYVPTRVGRNGPIQFSFDWEALTLSHHLADYDLLIFNKAFNHLDRFNSFNRAPGETFNGTLYNGKWPGDYMLRLRKYGSQLQAGGSGQGGPGDLTSDSPLPIPRLQDYDRIHHIFLIVYQELNRYFPVVPQAIQSIHLYPGGGFYAKDEYKKNYDVQPGVLLFPTQAFISDYVRTFMPMNPAINVFGAALCAKGARMIPKQPSSNGSPLVVAFTSLGDVRSKGADLYVSIAQDYRRTFPKDNITFLGIGNVPSSPAVQAMQPMPQADLLVFYRDTVDVIMSLERTDRENGWPLGIEAVLEGAVLFTMDKFGLNEANGFNFGDGIVIVSEWDTAPVLDKLHSYVHNRELLRIHSRTIQERAFELFSFEKQVGTIFGALERSVDQSRKERKAVYERNRWG
jgi:hypothetical protein